MWRDRDSKMDQLEVEDPLGPAGEGDPWDQLGRGPWEDLWDQGEEGNSWDQLGRRGTHGTCWGGGPWEDLWDQVGRGPLGLGAEEGPLDQGEEVNPWDQKVRRALELGVEGGPWGGGVGRGGGVEGALGVPGVEVWRGT